MCHGDNKFFSFVLSIRVARFFLINNTKMGKICIYQITTVFPNGIQNAKWSMYIPNGQQFSLQDTPKCTQSWIFWFANIPTGNPVEHQFLFTSIEIKNRLSCFSGRLSCWRKETFVFRKWKNDDDKIKDSLYNYVWKERESEREREWVREREREREREGERSKVSFMGRFRG
jgi:hypothetical protein